MTTHHFPNGFESWQKTHFEVVEVLCYLRDLEGPKKTVSFDEAADQSATEELYQLAMKLTDKYEAATVGKKRTQCLFDEIEEFVKAEIRM